jgi:osmoprotectant transport system ATP-binding protein
MEVSSDAAVSMIRLDAVSKSFDGGASFAVRSVSLDIPRGAFVALVGGSGSGKTTTLKMINRLIAPDAGQVYIAGEAADTQVSHELRRRIGYVFQGIGLFPHLTVAENIGITLKLLRRSSAEIDALTLELLSLVDLPAEFASRLPSALSGGQRQRVGVARALAAKPRIMLMDEPFGALDPLTRDALGTEYRRLHDRLGLTTLMVTHDVMEAVLLADRIIAMRAGRVVADGSPRALMEQRADPEIERLMDMPRRQAARVQALLDE